MESILKVSLYTKWKPQAEEFIKGFHTHASHFHLLVIGRGGKGEPKWGLLCCALGGPWPNLLDNSAHMRSEIIQSRSQAILTWRVSPSLCYPYLQVTPPDLLFRKHLRWLCCILKIECAGLFVSYSKSCVLQKKVLQKWTIAGNQWLRQKEFRLLVCLKARQEEPFLGKSI